MADFITGVVNEYYASAEDAAAGLLPVWRDEVYARQNLRDPAQWDVMRAVIHPVLPRGTALGQLYSYALLAAVLDAASGHEVQTVARSVDLKTAFDMVRQHEMSPPALPFDEGASSYTRRQVREPANSMSDWKRLKL